MFKKRFFQLQCLFKTLKNIFNVQILSTYNVHTSLFSFSVAGNFQQLHFTGRRLVGIFELFIKFLQQRHQLPVVLKITEVVVHPQKHQSNDLNANNYINYMYQVVKILVFSAKKHVCFISWQWVTSCCKNIYCIKLFLMFKNMVHLN